MGMIYHAKPLWKYIAVLTVQAISMAVFLWAGLSLASVPT